ncbi:MAG: NAD(+) synthase [Bacteroidetes bacterium]|nr:NAD(+) synthase [Bacteroidota bacterium]MBU1719966.1 NAD(+) synthase [Bacteroidota bacterium]
MNHLQVADYITGWLKEKLLESGQKGFVVGVSGGIDSALVSTLCARTGYPTIVLSMPIHQPKDQFNRANEQVAFLEAHFPNVKSFLVDLTESYETIKKALPEEGRAELALVNTRSRLRMLTLYSVANSYCHLVAGTGNKIEDYGIGFFTKYGDGGVDISPIGDLVKSEVYAIAGKLGVPESILRARPTDGLWETDRTDEEQIGATYDELEWAMQYCDSEGIENPELLKSLQELDIRQLEVLDIYLSRHIANAHKMQMPPVCELEVLRG